MKIIKISSLIIAGSILLSACGGTTPTKQLVETSADPYPEWFYNPVIENGLAAASCVPIPGVNVSAAQKHATANGRSNLAFQIGSKVKAMSKAYERITSTNEGSSVGGNFEEVTKQVTSEHLTGARAVKFARVIDDNKKMLCALVTLNPETSNNLFTGILKATNTNLSPDSEAVLKEQFLAYKSEQQMDRELEKQNK